MTIRNLEALLKPASVALVGASPRTGSVGYWVTRNLLSGGFVGRIELVNPKHGQIEGHPCHASVSALAAPPDLAVIVTPAPTVPGLVSELAEHGTKAVVCISAGIDAALRQQMLSAAKPRTLRILGPNCIGLALPRLGLNASFAHIAPNSGDLAFLSQSGALITAVIDWAATRGVGFSHVISLGDMADVDFGDLLDYLAGDIASRAILIYMEAVTNAPKFMSAARRAARSKPVIIVKSGRNDVAARAAMSHTGALAGSDAAYDAAFRRAGLLRVMDLEELFEAAEILSISPKLYGERLLILTNGGGAGVLAADRLADLDGRLAPVDGETRSRLDEILPPGWSHANPVDIIGDADPERYCNTLDVLMADESSDAVLAINCPTALASSTAIAEAVVQRIDDGRTEKPLLTCWLGDPVARDARTIFNRKRIPTFETPGAAVRGFMHLVRHRRAQSELMQTPPASLAQEHYDAKRVNDIIGQALSAQRTTLSSAEAKAIIAAYGIPTAQAMVAHDVSQVRAIAETILRTSKAVVLKILSDDISHKSDVGGVRMGLTSPAEAQQAAEVMLDRVTTARPDARIDGFTVEPFVRKPHGVEIIVGASVDRTFGPVVLFGAGGTAVEVLKDTSMALPPLDHNLAADLVSRTRVARLLQGYRDRPPADADAITRALMAVSALMVEHPAIRELDVNPVVADEDGVVALDARIRIADPHREPRRSMSIKPYPSHWQRNLDVGALGPVPVRPILPSDEHLYAEFMRHTSPEDLRMRLFSPQKELSHRFLARLTQIDYAREMAFVALSSSNDALLGVVRLVAEPNYERAEYAIIVRSDMKGRGLGWALMSLLIEYARSEGLQQLHGTVLATNTRMLQMCREFGFQINPDPDDSAVRIVELALRRMTTA